MANSKLSTEDSISIVIPNENIKLLETRGKVFYYGVFNLKCQAFEEMTTPLLDLYVEYNKEMKIYLKNKWR